MDKVQPAIDDGDDKPLDPAMEKVRRKMVRLLAISIGIMMAGIAAVLFAIVAKINSDSAPPSLQALDLVVPDGYTVTQSNATEDRITLQTVDSQGAVRILVYSATSGELLVDASVR